MQVYRRLIEKGAMTLGIHATVCSSILSVGHGVRSVIGPFPVGFVVIIVSLFSSVGEE